MQLLIWYCSEKTEVHKLDFIRFRHKQVWIGREISQIYFFVALTSSLYEISSNAIFSSFFFLEKDKHICGFKNVFSHEGQMIYQILLVHESRIKPTLRKTKTLNFLFSFHLVSGDLWLLASHRPTFDGHESAEGGIRVRCLSITSVWESCVGASYRYMCTHTWICK